MTNDQNNLKLLEETLGYTFQNQDLLLQALTHRSYLNENPEWNLDHNERLEFLGDAVLELVVTDHLYDHYQLPEGELTNLRAAIVRGEMLAKISEEMALDNYMLMSRGEKKDTGKARQYILANAMEALIGALYLDSGYDTARTFVERRVVVKLEEVVAQGLHIDNKSRFQEIAQAKFRVTPRYEVLKETGLDHAKHFLIGVFVGDKKMGEGIGSSKQEAQQQAAKAALVDLEDNQT